MEGKNNFNFLINQIKSNFYKKIPKIYKKPSQISITITNRCNSKCITCGCWNKIEKDISKKYILKFINQVFSLTGPISVTLDGGEPLIRKDIFEIIHYIHKKGGYVRIMTNGLLLDRKMIDKLVKHNISSISISLNGIDSKIHDSSRGVPGNLKRIFKAIDYIKEKYPSLNLDFCMTVYNQNLDQVIPTIEYANKMGCYISLQPVKSIFYASEFKKLKKDPNKILEKIIITQNKKLPTIIKKIQKKKYQGYGIKTPNSFIQYYSKDFKNQKRLTNKKNCKIGYYNLRLYNNGNIKVCTHYSPIGNIKKSNINELWIGKNIKKQRKLMSQCNKNCMDLCHSQLTLNDFFGICIHFLKKVISKKNRYQIFSY